MIETTRLRLIRWEDAHFKAILEQNLEKLGELLDVETPTAWTTFDDMTDALPFFMIHFKRMAIIGAVFFLFTRRTNNCSARAVIKVRRMKVALSKSVTKSKPIIAKKVWHRKLQKV